MATMILNNHKNAQLASQLTLEVAEVANNKPSNDAEITNKINQVQKLLEKIVAAKQEQANCIHRINNAVGGMEKDIQSNATTSMELAKSSNILKELIGELDKTSDQS